MKERNLIIKKEDMLIIGGKKSKKRKLKKSKKKRRKSYKKAKGREERKTVVTGLLNKAFERMSFKDDPSNTVPNDVLELIAESIEVEIDLYQNALDFIFRKCINNNNIYDGNIYEILNKKYRELDYDVLNILVEYYRDLNNNKNIKNKAFKKMKTKLSDNSLFNQERIDSLSDPRHSSVDRF